jgi:hypothetical protein
MPKINPAFFEEDPEIMALSDSEIKTEVVSMYGIWADRDDIGDDWLNNMRSGWSNRLEDLYGPDSGKYPTR